ncbi:hypothetical protein [Streptomyces sp. AK010]|uniref:hypothetical protein n=1 Tax=Streptomyces sp. AK010 TaxID=2723074 RepID=UPI00161FF05A|nr:hypothetical protein [Streptomyces sp. AK010]MBB6415453.1 hypothetical protein [Streptomyces sp. AK010]
MAATALTASCPIITDEVCSIRATRVLKDAGVGLLVDCEAGESLAEMDCGPHQEHAEGHFAGDGDAIQHAAQQD